MDERERSAEGAPVVARPPEARRRSRPGLEPLATFAVGFGMGTADLVPGFSGGTVALVTGIYQRLVANVRQGARALSLLVRLHLRDGLRAIGAIEWVFMGALLGGIGTALIALATVLRAQIAATPIAMSALFFGLVVGATVVAVGELRTPGPRHLLIGAAVALTTFVALGLRGGTLDDPSLLVMFLAGAVAVCAMILPGVSGAFLLVLLGVYQPALDALSDRDLTVIAVVGGGCLVGLATFSTLLHWLLRHHHDVVLAALLGLMAGSTRVLWPWPSATGMGDPALGAPAVTVLVPTLLAVGATLAVIALGVGARRLTARHPHDPGPPEGGHTDAG